MNLNDPRARRFCPKNHDKEGPNAVYWRNKTSAAGKVYQVRDCAECNRLWNKAHPKVRAKKPRVQKTHCKRGHEFTLANIYIQPDTGARNCRTCRAMHSAEWNKSHPYKNKENYKPERRFCKHEHDMFAPHGIYRTKSGKKQCAVCHRNQDKGLPRGYKPQIAKRVRIEPVEAPEFISRLERFLAMKPPSVHGIIPFERKAI